MIFAAYAQPEGKLLAQGGRYDDVGKAFGRARPAIGFSMDLLDLVHSAPAEPIQRLAILAPNDLDAELQALVKQLRLAGERVITAFPGQLDTAAPCCDRQIVKRADGWIIELIPE